MDKLLELIKANPAVFQGVIQAFIALVMSFGIGLTAEQVGSITAFTAVVLAFVTRSQVTPNHVVAEKVTVALNTPVPTKE